LFVKSLGPSHFFCSYITEHRQVDYGRNHGIGCHIGGMRGLRNKI
jgi:hypothetical protein